MQVCAPVCLLLSVLRRYALHASLSGRQPVARRCVRANLIIDATTQMFIFRVIGGELAHTVAETVAHALAVSLGSPAWLCSAPGCVWFLRVDMVSLDSRKLQLSHIDLTCVFLTSTTCQGAGTWLLNELEFFGNADLHFECMKDAPLLFDDMRSMAQCFMGATWAAATGLEAPAQASVFVCLACSCFAF